MLQCGLSGNWMIPCYPCSAPARDSRCWTGAWLAGAPLEPGLVLSWEGCTKTLLPPGALPPPLLPPPLLLLLLLLLLPLLLLLLLLLSAEPPVQDVANQSWVICVALHDLSGPSLGNRETGTNRDFGHAKTHLAARCSPRWERSLHNRTELLHNAAPLNS